MRAAMLYAPTLLLLSAVPAVAQDVVPMATDQFDRQAEVMRHRMLNDRTVTRNKRYRQRGGTALSAEARSTCANKGRVAAGLPAAKARQLMSLCAQAGY